MKLLQAILITMYIAYKKIFMIGDSVLDNCGHDPRIIHLAVGNAEAKYKQICKFVAKGEVTAGVAECLEWIEKTY